MNQWDEELFTVTGTTGGTIAPPVSASSVGYVAGQGNPNGSNGDDSATGGATGGSSESAQARVQLSQQEALALARQNPTWSNRDLEARGVKPDVAEAAYMDAAKERGADISSGDPSQVAAAEAAQREAEALRFQQESMKILTGAAAVLAASEVAASQPNSGFDGSLSTAKAEAPIWNQAIMPEVATAMAAPMFGASAAANTNLGEFGLGAAPAASNVFDLAGIRDAASAIIDTRQFAGLDLSAIRGPGRSLLEGTTGAPVGFADHTAGIDNSIAANAGLAGVAAGVQVQQAGGRSA
jgi:hypothetical protein